MADWLVIPGEPVGQGRPRAACINGKARVYDPPKSREWKEYAANIIAAHYEPACVDEGPCQAWIEAYHKRPKAMKPGPAEPRPSKPDGDNLAKAILDAAQQSHRVFTDDAQVTTLVVSKFYQASGREPCVRFRVEAI